MRLAWLTDLHLNFVSARKVTAFVAEVAALQPDAILLGGDVGEANSVASWLEMLTRAWTIPIFFVLGNHDFYHGSIEAVRTTAAALTQRHPALTYLSGAEPVLLPGGTLLVGTDGWGDGGFGDAVRSHVRLNDFVLIEEVQAASPGNEQRALLARLGQDSAAQLHRSLTGGLEQAKRVICLTHVPPFREAAWHEGRISDENFLPWFSCRATGEVLRTTATAHPDKPMLVLCGHTHGVGEVQILPNLRVLTGGTEYGHPKVQCLIDASAW